MSHANDRTLYLIEAALFILLGMVAIAIPGFFTLSLELLCGSILVVGGLYQLYRIWTKKNPTFYGFSIFGAMLNIILGILLLINPIAGMFTLTILLIAYFLVTGVMQFIWAWQLRPHNYWWGILASGILSVLMGLILIFGLPGSVIWALGLLFGINLLFSGIALWSLAWHMPSLPEDHLPK